MYVREIQVRLGRRTHEGHVKDVDDTAEVAHKSMSHVDITGESEERHLFRAPV